MSAAEQLWRAWLELMQVRTFNEQALNMWADWWLTWHQAVFR